MRNAESSSEDIGARAAAFTTTHWSVVVAAGHEDSSQAGAALETLCRTYWYPLYAYVRRRGQSEHDAQDLIQGFFALLRIPGQIGQLFRFKSDSHSNSNRTAVPIDIGQ